MKKLIYLMLLVLLLFVSSCVPTKRETVETKLTDAGFNVLSYDESNHNMEKYNQTFGYEGCDVVITAFINDGTKITEYVNIMHFDTIKHAKVGLDRVIYMDEHAENPDETVYDFRRSGKWVYYGTKDGLDALEK